MPMKRTAFFIIALLLLHILPTTTRAQQAVDRLQWVTLDLWPDYDRPSVLVLVTGALPDDAPTPAQVTLPLPDQATINAVARISGDNQMVDDIEFTVGDDSLTLVTPDRRFRVEYYIPYEQDGLRREFQFTWQADLPVAEVDASVQEPLAAASLETTPETDSVLEGNDGLQYHNLPVRSVAAGEPYTVEVVYTMNSNELTAAAAEQAGAAATSPADPGAAGDEAGAGLNWPVVLAAAGGLLVLLAIGWQLFGQRLTVGRRAVPRKPRPTRSEKSGPARFCHNCGTRAQPGDRFCRECGTRLKGT